MRTLLYMALAATVLAAPGCKDDEDLDPGLYGTWQVTKVQGLYYWNNTPTIPVSDNDPSGTIRFDDDGTGYQNYSFQIAGGTNQYVGNFVWTATDSEIIIDRVDEPDMSWVRDENLTNRQVATYTLVLDANEKWDYTLTLER